MEKNIKTSKRKEMTNFQQTVRVFFARGLIVKVCFAIAIIFILLAIFAPFISPYDPNAQELRDNLQGPSSSHIFGTDQLGRDVLSRIIFGTRVSLYASLLAGLFGAVIGIFFGLLAGYFGKLTGQIIMRITDAMLSIPGMIMTLVIASVLGGGLQSIIIAIGISMIPTYIRMMNGLVLSLKENDFVVASKVIGQKSSIILLKHLLPNCFPSLIVLYTINLGRGIMLEATLSFLGVGIMPPTATWGGMVSDGYSYLTTAPLMSVLPGICIILIVVAFNIVGDGLRDALDPRLRGKL